jgi:guanylate kinase
MIGVILYGPPAAGKSTVTEALRHSSPRYLPFDPIKVGGGRAEGYRVRSAQDLALLDPHEIVWQATRYGATYVFDRTALTASLDYGIVVLQLGQPDAIQAIRRATISTRWVIAHLYCPRDVALDRIASRGDVDAHERMRAWDETPPLSGADLALDTSASSVETIISAIHRATQQHVGLQDCYSV